MLASAAIRALLLALIASAAWGVASRDQECPGVHITLSGVGDEGRAWIAILPSAGEALPNTAWRLVEGREFQLEGPFPETSLLCILAKDSVPVLTRLAGRGCPDEVLIQLSNGLVLEGLVRSDNGTPLSDARFQLPGYGCGLKSSPELSRPSWTSNAVGVFRIEGLERGEYEVAVDAFGHVPRQLTGVRVDDERNWLDVELAEAFYITAVVVDNMRAPVVAADLEVSGSTSTPEIVRTDQGVWRIGPLERGEVVSLSANHPELGATADYRVQAPKQDLLLVLRPDVLVRGFVTNGETGSHVSQFRLTAHRNGAAETFESDGASGMFEVRVDWRVHTLLVEANGYVAWMKAVQFGDDEVDLGEIPLSAGRRVTGTVRASDSGLPLAGVLVRRVYDGDSQSGEASRFYRLVTPPSARTDAEGRFELHGMPERAVLRFGARGRTSKNVRVSQYIDHVDVELGSAGSIAGQMVTENGSPTGGYIWVWSLDTSAGRRYGVGEDGNFTVENLSDGRYRLTPDSVKGTADSVLVDMKGEAVQDIILVVKGLGKVRGTVRGLYGTERVSLRVVDENDHAVAGLGLLDRVGNEPFEINGIREGRFKLKATTTAGRETLRPFELDQLGTAEIDVTFDGRSSLAGIVTSSGQPVHGIEVKATPKNTDSASAWTRTTDGGHYEISGLEVGEYVVGVGEHDGSRFFSRGMSFDVIVSGDTKLNLQLEAFTLSGTIRSARAIDGIWVAVSNGPSLGPQTVGAVARVDSLGRFRIDALREGDYTVKIISPQGDELESRTIRLLTSTSDFDFQIPNE